MKIRSATNRFKTDQYNIEQMEATAEEEEIRRRQSISGKFANHAKNSFFSLQQDPGLEVGCWGQQTGQIQLQGTG